MMLSIFTKFTYQKLEDQVQTLMYLVPHFMENLEVYVLKHIFV